MRCSVRKHDHKNYVRLSQKARASRHGLDDKSARVVIAVQSSVAASWDNLIFISTTSSAVDTQRSRPLATHLQRGGVKQISGEDDLLLESSDWYVLT